jgi:hypothetical protein
MVETGFGAHPAFIQCVLAFFSSTKSGRGIKLTAHLQLVLTMPRSKNMGLYIHSPIRLNGVMRNWLSTCITVPFTYLVTFADY